MLHYAIGITLTILRQTRQENCSSASRYQTIPRNWPMQFLLGIYRIGEQPMLRRACAFVHLTREIAFPHTESIDVDEASDKTSDFFLLIFLKTLL